MMSVVMLAAKCKEQLPISGTKLSAIKEDSANFLSWNRWVLRPDAIRYLLTVPIHNLAFFS